MFCPNLIRRASASESVEVDLNELIQKWASPLCEVVPVIVRSEMESKWFPLGLAIEVIIGDVGF